MASSRSIRDPQSEIRNPLLPWFAFATVSLAWGSTYVGIRIGMKEDMPPALFSGTRFLASGLILLAACLLTGRALPAAAREWGHLSISGVLLITGGNGLLTWASRTVPAGLAALVLGSVPIVTSVIDALVPGGRPLRPAGWAGMLVGFAGVGLLIGPDFLSEPPGSGYTLGLAGLLVAGLSWSAGTVWNKRHPPHGSLLAATAVQMLAGGAALTAIGCLAGETGRFSPSPRGWAAIAYLLVVGALIGFCAFAYLIRAWSVARASTYCYVNPIVAVVIGWFPPLNERLEPRALAAAAVILAGVALVNRAHAGGTAGADEASETPAEPV